MDNPRPRTVLAALGPLPFGAVVPEPVLVVEDDVDLAFLIQLQLGRAGFEVLEAGTGAAAIDLVRQRPPAAIVLDYMLPDMDGLAVIDALRTDSRTAAVPVIMLTARAHERDQLAAWDAGVADFLVKPFESTQLIEAVRGVLAPDASRRRHERRTAALTRLQVRDDEPWSRMAALVEHSDDAIIAKSLEGVMLSWNTGATRLYGYAPEEAVGQHISLLVPPEHTDEVPAILERIGRGEQVRHFETVRLRKDGTRIHVSLTVSPIKDTGGRITAASTIARDVTNRRQAELRFRGLVETAPDAMVIVDEDGLIGLVNAQTEALFGYSRAELIGQPVEMLVPERFRAHHPSHRAQYSFNPRVRPMGAQLSLFALRKDGTEFEVEISLSPLQTDQGVTISAAIRDVTERKQAEARFRGLLEAAPDAMVIVDATGRIELVNAQAEALFGYDRGELVGQQIEILVPESLRAAHPTHRQRYFAEPRTRPMGQGLDLIARRRDGSVFPAEISLSSIETASGRLVSAAIRDVTERKQAEARFRGLIEAAPDAMVIVNAHGRIELVNAQTEAMFGYARDELLGEPVEVLVPPRFRVRHPEHRARYGHRPRVRGMGEGLDLHGLRKDGREFPVEISLSPVATDHGVTIAAAIRDVTARKQAEVAQAAAFAREREATRRLREVDRLRADFLSTVSHELRTPLTAIRGFAEVLVQDWEAASDDEKLAIIERIERAGIRLNNLIEDLLDFSRLERGQLELHVVAHEVERLVANVLRRAEEVLVDHKVDVEISPGLIVMADATAFNRVLENLLTNAAKFSPTGSTIRVRAGFEEQEVVIAVADEGSGIPAAEQGRVFERFYRGGEIAGRKPGTGIGLAVVREFTEAQKGRVSLRSEEGQGAEFRVHLPAAV